ncbi:MAG: hypothetical protein UX80_C0002G0022 [Candidatus Amesbacteria bacterium GW2011_GWA2_47_11b]|uniref:Glycosyltransferase RgtA/B/C/D-like domain-containing protein n=3 Tax=Candidatus Amesiibacteriota TaxID=1752730 RepID=A0A0G1UW57_9BACT|nr:MAG: hypothetical protein UX42_C0001G0138 [Microgenomates group bacterium GW2011_GWC1_46_20]KKU58487.1 MAG: hypothetical protein UX80_C0002G0022 [Candidatus Amesbacteria bacterium GW2011_GWA2_47_11b]KKU70263.1 MAG: hypothetical protein UX92_C0002G0007 [Candidatus Amesbacteria bacterium GW2011_GWA1_47_20]KKU84915.1 MAG: hypothetical protein UY11_C0001G0021 [Candidatus Amesbacteria bacterium GW2011_GWC2_47_8]
MKNRIILAFILLLGLGLRLFHLDSRPLGFTWDEAALGYNAYSLFLTGRDEYAQVMPLILKSFGDYKPALYSYLAVPSISVLGLTEFATRLPSAIFGVLLIIVVYLLTRNVFAAGLLAINPWSLYFSRGAWEANVALTLTTLATLLFIRRRYLTSALFFGLTLLTYQGAKMFTPLLMLTLLLIYRPAIKLLVKPLFLLLLLILPILVGFASQSGRLKVFSVFSYTRRPDTVAEILRQDNGNPFLFSLFHLELIDQGRGVLQRYLNHLSPYFLFFAGDWQNLRHSIAYYGYFHLPEILTILIGLVVLLRTNNPLTKLLIAWLLLAPLPSALSRDLVSGVRSLPLLVPLVIVSGMGLAQLSRRRLLLYSYTLILLFFLVYYLDLFYIHSSNFTAVDMVYPYKPVLAIVKQHLDQYRQVIFSDKLGQPYIFTLFYLQIDPRDYQPFSQLAVSPVGDVGHVDRFGKFIFRPLFLPDDRLLNSTILIGDRYELPESDLATIPNLIMLGDIKYPNGAPGLRVVGLP